MLLLSKHAGMFAGTLPDCVALRCHLCTAPTHQVCMHAAVCYGLLVVRVTGYVARGAAVTRVADLRSLSRCRVVDSLLRDSSSM
jgi:hypothetical protein